MTTVAVERVDGVATVTLSAPATRNALTPDISAELAAMVRSVEDDDDIRAVVVTGGPDAFCAGAHRDVLARADEGVLRDIYAGFLAVARCTLPTIAAINGPAVGAGCNLAFACDVRIIGESATLDTRFLHLGVHCGGGATWMMTRAAGIENTAAMLVFGEPVDGGRAAQLGLAWRCVPDSEVLPEAQRMASAAGAAPRDLLRLTKDSVRAALSTPDHASVLELELERQVWSFRARRTGEPWDWSGATRPYSAR